MNDSHITAVLKAYVHDLKGSLGANAAFARIILEEYNDKLDDKALRWLSLMANEYALTNTKITRLSQYAQLCNYQLHFDECQLDRLIDKTITRVISDTLDTLNAVDSDASELMGFQLDNIVINYVDMPTIIGDCHLLRMFFYELIANTYQHALRQFSCNMQSGADHLHNLHNIHINYEVVSNCHQIQFIEHNTTLLPQDLHYILQPLKTLDTSQSELIGAGLGFSILHRIAELLSGNVVVTIEQDTDMETQQQTNSGFSLVVTLAWMHN